MRSNFDHEQLQINSTMYRTILGPRAINSGRGVLLQWQRGPPAGGKTMCLQAASGQWKRGNHLCVLLNGHGKTGAGRSVLNLRRDTNFQLENDIIWVECGYESHK